MIDFSAPREVMKYKMYVQAKETYPYGKSRRSWVLVVCINQLTFSPAHSPKCASCNALNLCD